MTARTTSTTPSASPQKPTAVVASFTAQLRQTVNLDTMQGELSSTVHRAFEPAHVSIWSADGSSRS